MPIFQDQLGRTVTIPSNPQRIVSLVPSQTELLFDLGLGDRVVGRTKFCIHPEQAKKCRIVGGTKDFTMTRIEELNPDLIIANKEENDRDRILRLEKYFPVWISDVSTLEDAVNMINAVGHITGKSEAANVISGDILSGFTSINPSVKGTVLYFIWKNPWMVAGKGTFINEILSRMGLVNIAPSDRYPELDPGSLQELAPDHILLSSEPFPFREKHISEMQSIFPRAQVHIVNGEYFSWYGSRLVKAPEYLNSL